MKEGGRKTPVNDENMSEAKTIKTRTRNLTMKATITTMAKRLPREATMAPVSLVALVAVEIQW